MKALIVYAHPHTTGHCAAVLAEVTKEFTEKNVEFEVLDLYQMKFDPILHENELYTSGHRDIAPETKQIQDKISASNILVFIYPVWWGSMPAILKGFFDKTLTSRFAFQYIHGMPCGLLKDKTAVVFLTTGARTLLSRIFQHDVPISLIRDDILRFCGLKVEVHPIGHSLAFTPEREAMIKEFVRKKLRKILK